MVVAMLSKHQEIKLPTLPQIAPQITSVRNQTGS